MKKRVSLFLIIALVLSLALVGCAPKEEPKAEEQKPEPAPAPEKVFVNIATGGTAGTYFPLGGGMADIWNKNIPGMNATAESTGASVANVNMLRDGKVEVIFVQNDVAYYAATGTEIFTGTNNSGKYDGIRGLTTLYPETIQIVTLTNKGIETLVDLKGKKVAVGAPGSGTEANARQILEVAGLSYEDITEQYLSFAEAAQNLKDGNIDAAFITAGHPTAAVQDIGAQKDIKIVSIPADIAKNLIQKYPFYTQVTIPAGTYNKVDTDSETVAVMAMLAVDAKLDAELAYNLLKTMYGNTDRMKASHANGAMITKDSGKDGMSLDLHPGAEKFFNE
ncbi:MAG: C4-dicarboxylate ABC transporter substrate-binding protein [Peptococcaceae bacterium BICA1-8]|nr:MAG: C4-dicarboxylate ABC transporter substrate-binding protein [Peptococcaceae bacterium BICA1-8]